MDPQPPRAPKIGGDFGARAALESLPTLAAPPSNTTTDPRSAAPLATAELEQPIDAGDRYEARKLIGMGGMGQVWAFRDRRIGREVALKRLVAGSEAQDAMQRRFLREARVQALLEHPAIVPVYDIGVAEDGSMYFTMRKIRGHTLEQVLQGLAEGDADTLARYSRRKLLNAFVHVCLAVDFAHARGVVHRDLKPGNIIFGDFGEVLVLDWGVAKLLAGDVHDSSGHDETLLAPPAETDNPEGLTVAGAIMGTPGYMPREQLLGDSHTIDGRADVYALGMILYELLALQRLHHGRSTADIFDATLTGVQAVPSKIAADVPPELDAVCVRATAVEPGDRFQTARALANAVERYLDGDRDLERRKELADVHASRAKQSAERALADASAESARSEAMQEVMKSLALDPEHGEARRTLVRLLVETPDAMPAEVETSIAESIHRERNDALGVGLIGYISWFLGVPLAMTMGVRDIRPIIAALIGGFACSMITIWIRSRRVVHPAWYLGLGFCTFVTIDIFSSWLGPFVLVPAICAVLTVGFAIYSRGRERAWFVAMGTLFTLLPFLGEALHLFPPAFAFRDGTLVLFPRAVELAPRGTMLGLLYTSVASVTMPALYLGRLRDSLGRAERKLFLHSWHLSQLAKTADATPIIAG